MFAEQPRCFCWQIAWCWWSKGRLMMKGGYGPTKLVTSTMHLIHPINISQLLWVCVSASVYMYVTTCICMCIYMYVTTCIWLYIYIVCLLCSTLILSSYSAPLLGLISWWHCVVIKCVLSFVHGNKNVSTVGVWFHSCCLCLEDATEMQNYAHHHDQQYSNQDKGKQGNDQSSIKNSGKVFETCCCSSILVS